MTSKRIRVVPADGGGVEKAALLASDTPGVRVIDASGRRAVSGRQRVLPRKPWAARTFWTHVRECPADTSFRIAAMPGGFAYRLGASRCITFGIVGRPETILGGADELEKRIDDAGASWILDGLPPIESLIPGVVSPASVQWTIEGSAIAVGDACLARDTLSSQGLAAGVSEALHAAALPDDALRARKSDQRLSHLRHLLQVARRCRFASATVWAEYASFLGEHVSDAQRRSVAV